MESSVSAYLQRYMALMVLHLFSEAGRPLKAAVSKLELACYLWLRELTSHKPKTIGVTFTQKYSRAAFFVK